MLPANVCIYCAGKVEAHSWGGTSCTSCGSVMVSDPPTAEELAQFYDGFLDDYHGGGEKSGAARRQLRWAQAYLAAVQQFASGGALLDIGPANNPFPNMAKAAGFQVSVMDYKPPTTLAAGIPFIEGSLNQHPDALRDHAAAFDVVTSWAVIEHCLDTHRAVELMAQFCKPGGHIVITTPEIGTIADLYGAGRTPWFYPPEHIFLISRKALRLLFEAQGCELVHARKFEFSLPRWIVRYGIVVAEGAAGLALKSLAPKRWHAMREQRLTKAAGITICVFRKNS